MKVLMHHSQRAARSFVRGLEIRLKAGSTVFQAYPELLTVKKTQNGTKKPQNTGFLARLTLCSLKSVSKIIAAV
jgi:hypothetical protein